MRKVNVYYGDVYAGQLVELSRGNYEFTYDDAFRADGSTPPVSVNLPKSQKVYHSERIFPVFTNMLPEGANRRALLGISQQDLSDYSGVGISTVKDLERGVGNPSLQTLQKILDVVGMEMMLQVKQTVK